MAEQEKRLELSAELMALAEPIRTVSAMGRRHWLRSCSPRTSFRVPAEVKEQVTGLLTGRTSPGRPWPRRNAERGCAREEFLGPGEIIGLLAAGLALLLMLGTVLAAALPIGSALVGVAVSVLAALALSGAWT